jgi:hypothetical protein
MMRDIAEVQSMYNRIRSEVDKGERAGGFNEEDHILCIQDAFVWLLNPQLPTSYLDGYFREDDES